MLGEAIGRVGVLLRGYEKKLETPEIRSEIVHDPVHGTIVRDRLVDSVVSKSFVLRVESYVRSEEVPVEIPQPSLTEYRAYVEWALILARKVSDVVESKKGREDDVLASQLFNDPIFRLDPLPKKIRKRIDKTVAHQTSFRSGFPWEIRKIDEWRKKTLDELTLQLRERQSERALLFEEYLGDYQREIDEYG